MKTLYCMLALLVLIGCAPTTKALLTGTKYHPYEGKVEVLFEAPKTEYEKIAIVSAQGKHGHHLVDIIEALQKEAAQLGANAIILGRSETSSAGAISSGYGIMASAKDMLAIAIRIKSTSK